MRRGLATVLLTALGWPLVGALGQGWPVPPCAGTPQPSAGAVGESLEQLIWIEDETLADWSPPACTGWEPGPTKVLLAGAGRFSLTGDTSILLARLAKVSAMTDMIYWSSSRGRWRHLFKEAVALSRPDQSARRADFVESDLVPDAEIYYWLEEDNPTSGVVYQGIVHERTPDRLVFGTVNRSSLRTGLLLLRREIAAPGEFRQLHFIERENDETWRYYTLVRLGRATSLAGTSAANYRNRAEAFFRYLAGLDMTREPPAAP